MTNLQGESAGLGRRAKAHYRLMNLTSAYWVTSNPFVFGASEKPYPGKLKATT